MSRTTMQRLDSDGTSDEAGAGGVDETAVVPEEVPEAVDEDDFGEDNGLLFIDAIYQASAEILL